MKDVLFVIPTMRMGGAEKALVSLLKALGPKKVNADLLLFEAGGVLQDEIPAWVNIIEADAVTRAMTLEMRYFLKDVIKSGAIGAAAARVKISLASKYRKKPVFSWGIIEKYIPRLDKHYDAAVGFLEGFTDFYVIDKVDADKKIGWIHIDMTGRKPLAGETEYYEQFDEIATISNVCKNAFVELFPGTAEKMHIIENVVIPDDIRNKAEQNVERDWEKNKIHLVSVGRLEYQKGMDIGAKACKILKDRGIPVCWHVYGKGTMQDEISQYVADNGLEDYFILEGLAPNPYPYMKASDILVQPSRWEGKSIVLDEAKILGKAIVVTNYPSVSDQITNGITGIVTGLEPEEIADGIEQIINDEQFRRKIELNCRNEPNRSIKAIETFYKMIEA